MDNYQTNSVATEPVFIVGMPRTGSKIYKNIINYHSDINISPEIFYLTPNWIRKDFIQLTQSLIGETSSDNSLDKLASLMFENKFFGTYWRDIKGEKKDMLKLLKGTNGSFKEIFIAILEYDAQINNKVKLGAKFPVHITKAHELQQWFPKAKFIHINRHPLAIYNSQKRKHIKNKTNFTSKILTLTKVFLVTIITYRSSYKFNRANKGNKNYELFEYEKLTSNPEDQIRRLCDFLAINYKPEMLQPPVKDSSYQINSQPIGIHQESSARWKKEVNYIEKIVFKLLTKSTFSN
ncbi:sulfotransferase family protein [Chondrinema litorale]|uniref:sulfotransferase family protein n=1 Tax=Chondrinema litorale TaxID=2994555 RepID=UPI0025429A92|nr:sulfotransferase [Chondrinema litorale]UZS00185.1 sulfotransferase [Chondrinema litorale]